MYENFPSFCLFIFMTCCFLECHIWHLLWPSKLCALRGKSMTSECLTQRLLQSFEVKLLCASLCHIWMILNGPYMHETPKKGRHRGKDKIRTRQKPQIILKIISANISVHFCFCFPYSFTSFNFSKDSVSFPDMSLGKGWGLGWGKTGDSWIIRQVSPSTFYTLKSAYNKFQGVRGGLKLYSLDAYKHSPD